MDDITLPHESARDDDDAFFIRPVREEKMKEKEVEFTASSLEDDEEIDTPTSASGEASDKVRLHFGKFVQLVANHSFIDIVDKNSDEEVIISSNLLTDLANAHDRVRERRMPLIFMAGLVIGIILTYIITK